MYLNFFYFLISDGIKHFFTEFYFLFKKTCFTTEYIYFINNLLILPFSQLMQKLLSLHYYSEISRQNLLTVQKLVFSLNIHDYDYLHIVHIY